MALAYSEEAGTSSRLAAPQRSTLAGPQQWPKGFCMSQFQDKVAIVTGGASGIGRALSEALGRTGAVVVVSDIQGDAALAMH